MSRTPMYTQQQRITLPMEAAMLTAVDAYAASITTTRTAWIQQAIREKLASEKKYRATLDKTTVNG